jgi:hypothetical protein
MMNQPDRDAPAADWMVYSDALQTAGDPRGELIALNAAVASGMSPADRDAYVAAKADALFGKAARRRDRFDITWRFLADRVAVRADNAVEAIDDLTHLFASPVAAALHAVELVGVTPERSRVDLTRAVAVLVSDLPRTVREVALVDERAATTQMLASRDFEPPDNLVEFGPLDAVFRIPGLEALRIDVADSEQLAIEAIDAPALRSFALRSLRYGSGAANPLSARLAAANWPQLRSFELRLPEEYGANIIADADAYIPQYAGDEDYEDRADEAELGDNYEGTDWAQLRPLLDNLAKLPLERLALTSFDSVDSLLGVVAASKLAPTLVELDLSDSAVALPDWFLANRALIAPLERLVLTATTLADADAGKLRGLGPEIVHAHSAAGATYRYVVGSE